MQQLNGERGTATKKEGRLWTVLFDNGREVRVKESCLSVANEVVHVFFLILTKFICAVRNFSFKSYSKYKITKNHKCVFLFPLEMIYKMHGDAGHPNACLCMMKHMDFSCFYYEGSQVPPKRNRKHQSLVIFVFS